MTEDTQDIREVRAELHAVEQRLREALRVEIHDLEQRLTLRIADLERAVTARIDRHMAQLAALERWQARLEGGGHVLWIALPVAGAAFYHVTMWLIDILRGRHG